MAPAQVQVLEETNSPGSKEMFCYQSTLDTIDVYNLGKRCENQVDVHIVDIWDVQAFCRHCDRWLKECKTSLSKTALIMSSLR